MIAFLLVYIHTKRSHKMTRLLQKLKKFFTYNQQSGLEAYIISKNPTNAAEVDHFAREYDSQRFIWGRGF